MMKALIVDDEKHVRDAIRLLVEWDTHGIDTIMEAADGEQAVELIQQHKPQLVMTDMMMPTMSGTALMEWMSRHAPSSKIIAISGHDDFSLVRHAMQHGGMDYILKPIDPDAVNNAIGKAVAAWKQEEDVRQSSQQQRMQANEFKPMLAEKLWSGLLDDPCVYEGNVRRLQREFYLPEAITCARLAVARIHAGHVNWRGKFGENRHLLFYSLVNIADELLNGKTYASDGQRNHVSTCGTAFRYGAPEGELIILMWDSPMRLEAVLDQLNAGLEQTFKHRLHFGVSSSFSLPAGISAGYAEAKHALMHRNLLKHRTHIHKSKVTTESLADETARIASPPQHTGVSKQIRLASFEEEWRLALLSGHKEQLRQAVHAFIEAQKQLSQLTPDMLIGWMKEWEAFRVRMEQAAAPDAASVEEMHAGIPDQMSIHFHCPECMDDFSWSDWEQAWLSSLTQLSGLLVQQKKEEQHIIYDIAKYVEQHYHEEVSLQDIAQRFYVSREYISRKFKQQLGINLSDYITNIRMDKALRLLLNPHLRIAQVAEMVGYQDEKYFSKVFKKTQGMSPNTYRKQQMNP
ncbi:MULTISPECIES: response regulator [unclassified Paenibacillus]|uniref:response regulator n=1 Tax=unclassified Paenibacillus TaxID=185978 RepID=UPI00088B5B60|nr:MULTISPECIES: response regulator [unclassified Paenibacillus]SDF30274.1 two-component system, response regulator YesN [Paenibacillus sp. cl6col]